MISRSWPRGVRTFASTIFVRGAVLGLVTIASLPAAGQSDTSLERKKYKYLDCVQTNHNCDYGTSAACKPSVPPTGPFSQGSAFQSALLNAQKCDREWRDCLPGVLSSIPVDLCKRFSLEMGSLSTRFYNLLPEFRQGCSPPTSDYNPENVREARFWCSIGRTQCISNLETAVRNLQDGDNLYSCVYYGEFARERDRRASDRIDQCATYSGYSPTEAERRRDKTNPPQPEPVNNAPPTWPAPTSDMHGGSTASAATGSAGVTIAPGRRASQPAAQAGKPDSTRAAPQASSAAAPGPTGELPAAEQDSATNAEQRREKWNNEVQAAAAGNDAHAAQIAGLAGAMGALGSEKGDRPRGPSWHNAFSIGFGLMITPLFENSEGGTSTEYVVKPSSNATFAGGMSVNAGAELWPLHWRYLGVGVGLAGAVAWFEREGGGTEGIEGRADARGYLGLETALSLTGSYGSGWRWLGTSRDNGDGVVDSTAAGETEYRYRTISLGARLCTSVDSRTHYCAGGLNLTFARDTLPFSKNRPYVVSLEGWSYGDMGGSLQVGWAYPVAGEATYGGSPATGVFIGGAMTTRWDFFSTPYISAAP